MHLKSVFALERNIHVCVSTSSDIIRRRLRFATTTATAAAHCIVWKEKSSFSLRKNNAWSKAIKQNPKALWIKCIVTKQVHSGLINPTFDEKVHVKLGFSCKRFSIQMQDLVSHLHWTRKEHVLKSWSFCRGILQLEPGLEPLNFPASLPWTQTLSMHASHSWLQPLLISNFCIFLHFLPDPTSCLCSVSCHLWQMATVSSSVSLLLWPSSFCSDYVTLTSVPLTGPSSCVFYITCGDCFSFPFPFLKMLPRGFGYFFGNWKQERCCRWRTANHVN